MDRHFAESVGRPDLIQLADGMFCLRFETMKVVSAMAAVQQLLDSGVIDRETTLLDSSSGIYAHALALAAHRHGLKCHIVGSTTVDETCLLYTSDAADDMQCVDLGGRRIIKKEVTTSAVVATT